MSTTMNKADNKTQSGKTEKEYPICNVVYDLIAMIHKKSQALEVYKKYEKDTGEHPELSDTLKEACASDRKIIGELVEQLRCALNKEKEGCSEKNTSQEACSKK